jgi:hypothetical protein
MDKTKVDFEALAHDEVCFDSLIKVAKALFFGLPVGLG